MHTHSTFMAGALVLALATNGTSIVSGNARTFTSNYENVLGTSLELKVGASTPAEALRAETAVLSEISRESKILSAWDAQSEFSRWTATRGTAVPVSPELFEVLEMYDTWRARTHGALDASAQTVIQAWNAAAANQRVPSAAELRAAVRTVQQRHWSLNAVNRTATHLSNAPLVLASFTKSYIIDHAADAAMSVGGVRSVVLNIGGDIAVRGAVAEPVGIVDPKSDADNGTPISEIVIQDRAVATSGDYRRGLDIGGVHYSHIVDPRTGMPADEIISSTVVARHPADAGALATAFSILTPAESRQVAALVPGTEYLLVTKTGATIMSPGWPALEAPAARVERAAAPKAATSQAAPARAGMWDTSMELSVNFEMPQLAANGKRPFIAIWIEDADRFPVRTLALWYHEDRFLTEMKAWYRADRLRSMSETTNIVRSIGSATRPAGKYTMKWDGKDNAGELVHAGKYTVYLESSREHGTYQLIRQEMNFTGTPQVFTFPKGSEIAAASFDYHKLAK